jgi:hypothetical protein
MADSTPQKQIYIAALGYPSGLAFRDFESTSIEATSESEAIDKAVEWSRHPERQVDSGMSLVVKTMDGRGIHSEQLGWTNTPEALKAKSALRATLLEVPSLLG